MRAWMVIAAVAGAVLLAVGGFLILKPAPSTADRIADAVKADADGRCERIIIEISPPRDDDNSKFQTDAAGTTLVNCSGAISAAQVIDYPNHEAVARAQKRRAQSVIYRAEKICVLDKSIVIGSFQHSETLTGECAKLGGVIEPPLDGP